MLQPLHHEPSARRVIAERAMNRRLEGGCQVPIACYAQYVGDSDQLLLRGLVGNPNGSQILRAQDTGSAVEAEQMGIRVAEDLLLQGAAAILANIYSD